MMSLKKKILYASVVIAFFALLGVSAAYSYENKKALVYNECLDLTAVTVDGEILTMSDLAYYIAREELAVEEQAKVYDYEDTKKYWKLNISYGKFMKTEAKDLVIDIAVHDYIFYRMALEQGVVLDEEEERLLELYQSDLWNDLGEEGREGLGVSEETFKEMMSRAAIGQKYQEEYTLEHATDLEDYDLDGEKYQEMLKEHKIKTNRRVWNRIPFGDIVIQH